MRLIDADALIKEFETFIEINKKAGGVVTDKDTVRLINDAPTIDAVEVVRCKDCTERYICTDNDDNDYCSYGEKK